MFHGISSPLFFNRSCFKWFFFSIQWFCFTYGHINYMVSYHQKLLVIEKLVFSITSKRNKNCLKSVDFIDEISSKNIFIMQIRFRNFNSWANNNKNKKTIFENEFLVETDKALQTHPYRNIMHVLCTSKNIHIHCLFSSVHYQNVILMTELTQKVYLPWQFM